MKTRCQKLRMVSTTVFHQCLSALVLAASLCCMPTQIARADTSADWRHLAFPANRAQRNGQTELAIKLWTQALGVAKKLGVDHPWYSISLKNLIELHFIHNDDINTIHQLIQLDLDALKPLGPTYADRTIDLMYLGRIMSIKGQFSESRKCYEEALPLADYNPISKDVQQQILLVVQVPYTALHADKEALEAGKKLIDLSIRRHSGNVADAEKELLTTACVLRHDGISASFANRRYFRQAEINFLTQLLSLKVAGPAADAYRVEMLRRRTECFFAQANIMAAADDDTAAAAVLRKYTDADNVLTRCGLLEQAAAFYAALNRNSDALPLLEESIRMREKIGSKTAGDARVLVNTKITLANCYLNLHKPEQTLAIYKSLLSQKLDAQTKGETIRTFVNVYDTIGDRKSFLEYLNKSRAYTAELHDSRYVIDCWAWLADRYAMVGESAKFEECMAQSLKIASRLYAERPDEFAKTRVYLGELWLGRRRPDLAAKLARQALAACTTKAMLNDWEPRGRALILLAQAEQQQRHYAEAIKDWNDALDFVNAKPTQFPDQVCAIPEYVATLYLIVGDNAHADEYARRARAASDLYTIDWNRAARVYSLTEDALVASQEGKFDQSNALCRQVISVPIELYHKFNAHFILMHNLIEQHKFDDAVKEAQEALDWRDARPQPYLHTISPNGYRTWIQLFTAMRARAIDLSGDHKQAQQVFAQLANDDYDADGGNEPLFAKAWCWRAENWRALGMNGQAEQAAKIAHSLYAKPGFNLFDERERCDSVKASR